MQTHFEIEDFAPKVLTDLVEHDMLCLDKWVWCNEAVESTPEVLETTKYLRGCVPGTFQFSHHVYTQEHGWNDDLKNHCQTLMYLFQDKLNFEIEHLVRIKANITTPLNFTEKNYCAPHADVNHPGHVSVLYYANDSDGDTRLFDRFYGGDSKYMRPIVKSSPQKGKALVFASDRFHSASLPIEARNRLVINFCFKPKRRMF